MTVPVRRPDAASAAAATALVPAANLKLPAASSLSPTGSSPATVKKHLERVYVKLGVETRTAAASVALSRLRPAGQG